MEAVEGGEVLEAGELVAEVVDEAVGTVSKELGAVGADLVVAVQSNRSYGLVQRQLQERDILGFSELAVDRDTVTRAFFGTLVQNVVLVALFSGAAGVKAVRSRRQRLSEFVAVFVAELLFECDQIFSLT